MKIYLFLFFTFHLYNQTCIVVKDFSEIQAKVAENPHFAEFEVDSLKAPENYYQKALDSTKEILTSISCTEKQNNISLCQSFFAEYKLFFESETDNMMCITVLSDCKIAEQHFLFRLKLNIYEMVITKNSYEMVVQFLGGINRMLLKGIKSKMLPLHNNKTDDQPKDNKIPHWITTSGYFLTKEGVMLVLSGNMQMNPSLIEGKFLNPDDIGFVTQDFVTFIKEIFEQAETCDDMTHAFYTQAGDGLLEVMDEDEFPQSFISTWNWLEENINQGLVEKHKWLMYFFVIAYCEGKVIYDESVLNVLQQMMNISLSYIFDSQEELEYFRDFFVYRQTMQKAKFEEMKAQYLSQKEGTSNSDNKEPKVDQEIVIEIDNEDDEIQNDQTEGVKEDKKEIVVEDDEQIIEQDPTLNQVEGHQEITQNNDNDDRLRRLTMKEKMLEKVLLSKDNNYKKQFLLKYNHQLNFKDQLNLYLNFSQSFEIQKLVTNLQQIF